MKINGPSVYHGEGEEFLDQDGVYPSSLLISGGKNDFQIFTRELAIKLLLFTTLHTDLNFFICNLVK